MDEWEVAENKELKSEIEKLKKPCDDEMNGLKDQIRK